MKMFPADIWEYPIPKVGNFSFRFLGKTLDEIQSFIVSLMREYNKELKAKGYIVVAGKISTKFLAEKIYGMKVED